MPRFSNYTPFGMFKFSAQPANSERIYDALRESQGGDDGPFREYGYQGAKLYAQAMGLARVQEIYDRVKEQSTLSKLTFLLDEREKEYGIAKDSSLTDEQRRERLRARAIAGAGAKVDALTDGLTAILGDNLLLVLQTEDPVFTDLVASQSPTPPTEANFRNPGEAYWGEVRGHNGPPNSSFFYYPTTAARGAQSEIVDTFKPNDVIVFGSHNGSLIQKCTVASTLVHAYDATRQQYYYRCTLTAPLTKPIEDGQGFTSNAYPYFPTGRRRIIVIVERAIVFDTRVITLVHDFLHRTLRVTTNWDINVEQVFGFRVGVSMLGFEVIQ